MIQSLFGITEHISISSSLDPCCAKWTSPSIARSTSPSACRQEMTALRTLGGRSPGMTCESAAKTGSVSRSIPGLRFTPAATATKSASVVLSSASVVTR